MNDAFSIFERYQSIRNRLPAALFSGETKTLGSLLDIADEIDAFVFDAFGVLNVGESPILGAAHRLDELRGKGRAIRVLSNAASYNHDRAVEKFQRLGMRLSSDEIITSRDAALDGLMEMLWGCIAAPSDDLTDISGETVRLGDHAADYDRVDGILFLSTETWTFERQAILEESLKDNPRRVIIANADIAAPRESGFSLEPGHFGHLLVDQGATQVEFFGKPFNQVFYMVAETLIGVASERIAMVGDTLHTDVLGAAALGWRTVLVEKDGMFSCLDAGAFCDRSSIHPTWRLARI